MKRINVNTATKADLVTALRVVFPKYTKTENDVAYRLATRIMEHMAWAKTAREFPLADLRSLLLVSGVGRTRLAKLEMVLTVSDERTLFWPQPDRGEVE